MAPVGFRDLFDLRQQSKEARRLRNTAFTLMGLSAWAITTFVFLLAYAYSFPRATPIANAENTMAGVLSAGGAISIGFAAVGSFFGFLFGIPRIQSSEPTSSGGGTAATAERETRTDSSKQSVYTNIETISDWLTKILVGAGLTQLNIMPGKLENLGTRFAPAMGGSWAISMALLLNSIVGGFFAGFLLTRLFLAPAFREADEGLLRQGEFKEFEADMREKVAAMASGLLTRPAGEEAGVMEVMGSGVQAVATSQLPPKDRAILFEATVYNYLYEDPPEGFQKAIEQCDRFLKEEPQTKPPRLLAYLSMAYGQQAKWEMKEKRLDKPLEETKRKAYEAAEEAIKLGPRMKDLLRMVWDVNEPTKSHVDDDLEVFYDDPEFRRLLG